MRWSFYNPETGEISVRTFTGSPKLLRVNTPRGMVAIEGQLDPLSQRVDVKTGLVVDYQPPQPDGDHEWNANAKRWVKKRDVALREVQERQTLALVHALESDSPRAVREALLLVLPDGPARARLQAIEDEIARLRPLLPNRVH